MPIHIPKRALRSGITIVLFFLGPIIILGHLASLSNHTDEHERWHAVFKEDHSEAGWKDAEGLSLQESNDYWYDELEFEDEEREGRGSRVKHGKPNHKGDAQQPAELSHAHRLLPNGLLIADPSSPHPIYTLIEEANKNWEQKLGKASRSLSEAADEYRRRYERNPPRGFDRWWNCQMNMIRSQVNLDLEPFHALTPSQLRAHMDTVSRHSGMYTISCPGASNSKPSARCTFEIVEGGLNDEGKRVANQRARAQVELLEDVEELLEEVQVTFFSHDVPWQFVGHEYVSGLVFERPAANARHPDKKQLDTAHLGWASACAPHKPLRETYDPSILPDLADLWQNDKSFIWDHKASMDPCIHPELTHLVGFLSGHGKGPGPRKDIYPVLAMCKTTLHADVLAVSMEAWTEDVEPDPAWEHKDDRMIWRGKTTGIFFREGVPWNISQRINLVQHTGQKEGTLPVLPPALDSSSPVGYPVETPLGDLNDDLVDVAFVDHAIQCDDAVCDEIQENYHFGDRKTWAEGNGYKYLLDLDGNGWSARFKRLMTTQSVVLKSTIFPEWYTDRIQPWVHYVPLKASLTDLYDVLAFFRSSPSHDDLAKGIGQAGREWSLAYWRKEDMIAYQFRLFLEIARLMAPDRETASFHLRGDDLE
ncbi:hypothetical protein L198_00829 [Cryptococcus wingfieldii CBS 7118]|uniref:Glycosyl transferase CAP10 domain-containing protein n=1 Tax=Cryptococcus wingfieldii CBS 7118 TaxID=1295528 RepID=A0A1E3K285_9TREE|nr:hypothetical protein L198_00829 [Cryptococcus wingfieldii CBS 7118]ODO07250.1 hypothetical protein L198_00829 [Cryptococcus wingfieldii CBS 7118]